MRVLMSFFLCLSLVACQNKFISEMNNDLDSLEAEMTEVEAKLSKLNPDTMRSLLDSIDFDMDYLELYLDEDTLSRNIAIMVGSYSDQTRNMEKWIKAFKDHSIDLDYSKAQLKSLREDVNNGLGPIELFNEYKPSEAKAISSLKESSSSIVVWYDSNLRRYEYLKFKVDSIVGKQVQ